MATDHAISFGTYLLGTEPHDRAVTLYRNAMRVNQGTPDAVDKKLLAYALAHPRSIAYIDAGLALAKPQSEFRRRLYVMFSILEATPEYHARFLPQKHSFWYTFVVIGAGCRGAWRAVIGMVLVKVVAQ